MHAAMNSLTKGLDILALVYTVLVFPAAFFWLIIHGAHSWRRRLGVRSLWVALPLWVSSGVAIPLLRHQLLDARFGRPSLALAAGGILMALATWIEFQTRRELGWRRMVGLAEVRSPSSRPPLLTSGIYARLRHPRYLGYTLGWLAVVLCTGARGILGLAILSILLYLVVAKLEEKELEEYYGAEYSAYRRAVPRFIPGWRRKAKPGSLC